MKNFLKFTFLSILFFTSQSKAQSLDTLNYLKQFEANKANYIGQPFSKLLNEMTQIQPKSVWNKPPWRKKSIILGSDFKFCKMSKSYSRQATLYIIWATPISKSQTEYYEQLNDYYFTNDEKSFYGNKIIKDIMVYR